MTTNQDGVPKRERRFLIAFDGEFYYVRRILAVEMRLDTDSKVYHCDQPIGRRYGTLNEAAIRVRKYVETGR